ncbi:MAG: hypothetical protein OCD00_03835 [Colwellia sp.]
MKGNSAILGMDLMTVNAIVFILVGLILASLVTAKEVMKNFEAAKTEAKTDVAAPEMEEMAKAYFVVGDNGEFQIKYEGEQGSKQIFTHYKILLAQLKKDAPKYLYLKVDSRYPYGDVGAMMMDAQANHIQIYMVAENE